MLPFCNLPSCRCGCEACAPKAALPAAETADRDGTDAESTDGGGTAETVESGAVAVSADLGAVAESRLHGGSVAAAEGAATGTAKSSAALEVLPAKAASDWDRRGGADPPAQLPLQPPPLPRSWNVEEGTSSPGNKCSVLSRYNSVPQTGMAATVNYCVATSGCYVRTGC